MFSVRVRRFVAVAVVAGASAAVLPGRSGGYESPPLSAGVPVTPGDGVTVSCVSGPADDSRASCSMDIAVAGMPPSGWPPAPVVTDWLPPVGLATNGVPGCVRGANRPVAGTVTPTRTVTFTGAGGAPIEVTFEEQRLDGSEDPVLTSTRAVSGEPLVNEAIENGLEPGASYRWRVRGVASAGVARDETAPVWSGSDPDVGGWSDWCEFTVAAGLVDMRDASDVAAVRELGVAPDRRYPVTLTSRQWRLLLEGVTGGDEAPVGDPFDGFAEESRDRFDRIGAAIRSRLAGTPAGGRVTVTLSGDDWAVTASETAAVAASWDEMGPEDPEAEQDVTGAAYWKVLDLLSAELDGPAHPALGYYR